MSNKRTAGGLFSPNFKLYYKAMVIKQQGIDIEHSHVDQWKHIEDLEIFTHLQTYDF